MEIVAAHNDGSTYNQDKLTVHNILIRDISDGSDAYAFLNPNIKIDNGRRDIKALRRQYENSVMHEQYANEANRNL